MRAIATWMSTATRAEKLGSRLFEARKTAGLSMRALAGRAGLSHPAINDIEKGHSIPAADTLDLLADALGVSPCWLAYGLGPKELKDPE